MCAVARAGILFVAWQRYPDLSILHIVDTPSYLEPARSLAARGEFSRDGQPELIRTPGYPLLLTAGVAAGHVELVTVALQAICSLITVAVVYRLTRSFTGSRAMAVIAGLLLAIEPLSVTYTCWMGSETLFTCLLMLTIAALVRYDRSGSLATLALAAMLLAAATFVRPISYYLPPVIAATLIGRSLWRAESRARCALAATMFLIVSCTPLVAWQVRNWNVARYSGFSAISDWNLYFYQGASIVAAEKNQSLEATFTEMGNASGRFTEAFFRQHPELRGASQVEAFRFLRQWGTDIVRQHPLLYVKIHLRGLLPLLLNPGASDVLSLTNQLSDEDWHPHPINAGVLAIVRQMHQKSPLLMYLNLSLAAILGGMYLTAAHGLLSSVRRRSGSLIVLVLVLGYLVAISAGPTGVARLRHPIMPLVCILSAIGIAELFRWRQGRNRRGSSLPSEIRVDSPTAKPWHLPGKPQTQPIPSRS